MYKKNSLFSDSDMIEITSIVLCMCAFTPLYTCKQNRQLNKRGSIVYI